MEETNRIGGDRIEVIGRWGTKGNGNEKKQKPIEEDCVSRGRFCVDEALKLEMQWVTKLNKMIQ